MGPGLGGPGFFPDTMARARSNGTSRTAHAERRQQSPQLVERTKHLVIKTPSLVAQMKDEKQLRRAASSRPSPSSVQSVAGALG